MKRVAVYCGSALPADPVYVEAARHVGRTLAERGIGVVYGGGRLGLMGAVADAALGAGGEVIGVIPDALVSAEVAHRGCTELHIVQTMHQRKALFTDLSDGFVTLPGGVGTMDELFEALTLIQTRKIRNFPIVLFGREYWSGMLAWLREEVLRGGKINEQDLDLFHVTDSPAEVVEIVTRSQTRIAELDNAISDEIRV